MALTDADRAEALAYRQGWADCLRAIRDGAAEYERDRQLAKWLAFRRFGGDEVTASLLIEDEDIARRRVR